MDFRHGDIVTIINGSRKGQKMYVDAWYTDLVLVGRVRGSGDLVFNKKDVVLTERSYVAASPKNIPDRRAP